MNIPKGKEVLHLLLAGLLGDVFDVNDVCRHDWKFVWFEFEIISSFCFSGRMLLVVLLLCFNSRRSFYNGDR